MTSERVQRQIDRLLDEAEAALASGDWPTVLDLAGRVLTIDPANAEAPVFLAAAERGVSSSTAPLVVAAVP